MPRKFRMKKGKRILIREVKGAKTVAAMLGGRWTYLSDHEKKILRGTAVRAAMKKKKKNKSKA